jgi:hypothetical protein
MAIWRGLAEEPGTKPDAPGSGVGVGLGVGLGLGLGLGLGVALGLGVGIGVGLGVGEREGDDEADKEALADGSALADADAAGVAEAAAVGANVGPWVACGPTGNVNVGRGPPAHAATMTATGSNAAIMRRPDPMPIPSSTPRRRALCAIGATSPRTRPRPTFLRR